MAISNFKKDNQQNNFNDLMCSAAGCFKPWSVKMEGTKPMCSSHQWSDNKPASARDIAVAFTQPPVQHWQDDVVF